MMFYTRLAIRCTAALSEQLTAELAEAGFDAFIETSEGLEAYAHEENFDQNEVDRIFFHYAEQEHSLHFSFDKIKKENWNLQWEESTQPVVVENKCRIRAAFHPHDSSYPYEIVITPRMSFGTGHHATTYLMIQAQMGVDHQNKTVMDAGCGTAILSIMASRLGAAQVSAFDIDEWSVMNGKENLEINGCPNVTLQQGKITDFSFEPGSFDLVLANINKNVLLGEMGHYFLCLRKNGVLILSGFYTTDIPELSRRITEQGWVVGRVYEKEKWAAMVCRQQMSA